MNANDVVFNLAGFAQKAATSPPSGNFLSIGLDDNGFAPYITGGFEINNTAGAYTDSITTNATVTWVSAAVALQSTGTNTFYNNTPLTDYTSGQLYLNKFPGFLYNESNTPDPQHDADGKAIAAQVQPLDANGNPSPNGLIGVAALGVSNFTDEFCSSNGATTKGCDPNTFTDQAAHYSGINPNMVLIDCAKGAAYAVDWTMLTSTAWSSCLSNLYANNVTPAQVQVVMFEAGEQNPHGSLSSLSGSSCPPTPNPNTDADACVYEWYLGQVIRLAKAEFPNLKQVFLQGRVYAGDGSKSRSLTRSPLLTNGSSRPRPIRITPA